VHFAIGCRKISSDAAEVRIFVNGSRVGAMRATYPVPRPPSHPLAAPQLHVKPSTPQDTLRVGIGKEIRDDVTVENGDLREHAAKGQAEGNEWMLGRALLLEEAVPEDMVLLMHHLVSLTDLAAVIYLGPQGPRYSGNFQEALGKFLTCEWRAQGVYPDMSR
jgi:hypothetical protein